MLTTACNATVTIDEVENLPMLTARLTEHGCPVPTECADHAYWKLTDELGKRELSGLLNPRSRMF